MNYRNIDDLNHCILQHLSILPRDFDLIVGVPRSGMFPANLLALYPVSYTPEPAGHGHRLFPQRAYLSDRRTGENFQHEQYT